MVQSQPFRRWPTLLRGYYRKGIQNNVVTAEPSGGIVILSHLPFH